MQKLQGYTSLKQGCTTAELCGDLRARDERALRMLFEKKKIANRAKKKAAKGGLFHSAESAVTVRDFAEA